MQPHISGVVVDDGVGLGVGVVHKHGAFLVGVFSGFGLRYGNFVDHW